MRAPQAAVEIREPFEKFTPKTVRPVLVMVSGLPGTGKSFFSRKLAERLPFIILESDEVRKKLFPNPTYSPAESTRVFREIDQRLEELLLQGASVIHDATNLKEKHRQSISKIAKSCGAKIITVLVEAPEELIQKRLKIRGTQPENHDKSDADWKVYGRMKATAEKIRFPHFTVNTARDITPAIDKIIKEINR
jgi:predicted kinase